MSSHQNQDGMVQQGRGGGGLAEEKRCAPATATAAIRLAIGRTRGRMTENGVVLDKRQNISILTISIIIVSNILSK